MIGLLFEHTVEPSIGTQEPELSPCLRRDQLVDRIVGLNPTANPTFLLRFNDRTLEEYLSHLQIASEPRGNRWVRSASTPAIVWTEAPTD
ncbi:MAG: hypothetical protein KF705_11635 [Phycisphaeraceae bacterium]|nr:hypothetical protein [Phycisphaeraceae bacterium]